MFCNVSWLLIDVYPNPPMKAQIDTNKILRLMFQGKETL